MSQKKTMTTRIDVTNLEVDEVQNELKKHIHVYREEGWHYSCSFPLGRCEEDPSGEPYTLQYIVSVFCE